MKIQYMCLIQNLMKILKIKNLLVIGKLDKRKGSIAYFRLVKYIQIKNNKQIIIIGEGPEKENLMKLSSDLGISQAVTFKGNIR